MSPNVQSWKIISLLEYKNKDKINPIIWRGIGLTSASINLSEKVILSLIENKLLGKQICSPLLQFGFRIDHGVTPACYETIGFPWKEKAFGRIWHTIVFE